ncbi:MAG TPA: N-6 DNA methylase [Verrucomicrobiae bacterium]|nr:N-6 DNA methylase [Verrucomicrobiae bacterium]
MKKNGSSRTHGGAANSNVNENGNGTRAIVQKLWNLCNILRDDGITYHEYVTELTYLLFLKMMEETRRETALPSGYRWSDLKKNEGEKLLTYYRRLLLHLGTEGKGTVREIFADAQTKLTKPANLKELVTQIDRLDWYSAKQEGLGDLYEGLLEKNASEKKSGAGQYFTPRPLVDCMVRLLQPQPGEIIQDPAAGTGGFLIWADDYIKERTDDLFKLNAAQQRFQREEAFRGLELVHDTYRLLLMNLILHDVGGGHIKNGDTLGPDGEALGRADVVLTNPPFGTKKGGGRPTRSDFSITADISNKQLAFVEHVVRALKPGGRAGMVVPDNVLFVDGAGQELRTWLMDLCNVHTILRLPTGIFYAQGVKTNVVFFQRGKSDKENTQSIWIYDMRADQPAYGKTRPLCIDDFAAFEAAYGTDPTGKSKRHDEGAEGRFRAFTREFIRERSENLDISWLRGTDEAAEEALEDPSDILDALSEHLERALMTAREIALTSDSGAGYAKRA